MAKVILIALGIAYGIPFAISFFVDNSSKRVFRRIAAIAAFVVIMFYTPSIVEHSEIDSDELTDRSAMEEAEDYTEADEETTYNTEISIYARDEIDIELGDAIPVEFVEASSVLYAKNGYPYGPELTLDGDPNSCWQEGAEGDGVGEYIRYDFDSTHDLQYITIVNGQAKSEKKYYENGRIAEMDIRFCSNTGEEPVINGEYYIEIPDEPGEYVLSLVDVLNTSEVDSVYIYINEVYPGSKWSDTCVSEISFY